ncbi:MAG: hypothetical protein U0936_15610 [Planctomycetaceae bacterium]
MESAGFLAELWELASRFLCEQICGITAARRLRMLVLCWGWMEQKIVRFANYSRRTGDSNTVPAFSLRNRTASVEVEVIADDPLKDDNRYAAAVTIWDSINVLLVDGDPSGQAHKVEADYLSIALTPFTFGRVRLADLVQTQTVQSKDLTEERLKTSRVVVLANVSRLEPAQVSALTGFVNDGGALLVCAGNKIDLNWYREQMFANGGGLLPAAFGILKGQIESDGKADAATGTVNKSSHIVAQHFDHPALGLASNRLWWLLTAEIRRWHEGWPSGWSQRCRGIGAAGFGRSVADRASSWGWRRVADGDVCGLDWVDLPVRPFVRSLMQQIIHDGVRDFSATKYCNR